MPNKCTFEEARRLAAELAPALARIPRADPVNLTSAQSAVYKRGEKLGTAAGAPDFGAIVVHVRRYLDLHEVTRAKMHDYCVAHGIAETTFHSSLTRELRLRAQPGALAERELIESAARTFLRLHPHSSRIQRSTFAQQHGIDPRSFCPALRRVEYILAFEAKSSRQKNRAA